MPADTATAGPAVPQELNVAFALLANAVAWPRQIALNAGELQVSYDQFAGLVVSFALHMRAHGAGRGVTVALASDDQLVVLASLYATGLIGARWMVAPPGEVERRVAGIGLLLDGGRDPATRLPGSVAIDESWVTPPPGAPAPFEGYESPDAVWLILQTSGTTGLPKLVALSHRVVTARNAANADLFPRPGVRITGLAPVNAPMLITRDMAALDRGAEIVAGAEAEEIEALGIDVVFGSPMQVADVMKGRVFARKLPIVYLGGATAHEGLLRHLMASYRDVINAYGATETHNTLHVHYDLDDQGALRRRPEVCGSELQIVDEAGNPLPEGTEGILRIRNDRLALGYLGAPELNRRIFRDGWFYPGDIARRTAEGGLEITGRVNDQFNLGGVKVNAALLDFTMQNVPGVRDAIAFMMPVEGAPDRLTALISVEPGEASSDVIRSLKIAMARLGSAALVPERFYTVARPPRTRTGKPDRDRCVEEIEAVRSAKRNLRAAREKASSSDDVS